MTERKITQTYFSSVVQLVRLTLGISGLYKLYFTIILLNQVGNNLFYQKVEAIQYNVHLVITGLIEVHRKKSPAYNWTLNLKSILGWFRK